MTELQKSAAAAKLASTDSGNSLKQAAMLAKQAADMNAVKGHLNELKDKAGYIADDAKEIIGRGAGKARVVGSQAARNIGDFILAHPKSIGAAGGALGALAGINHAFNKASKNENKKTAGDNKMNELQKQAAYNEYMKSPVTIDEVGIAKEAAAQLYEDCLNKLAFAEQLFGEADNLEKSAADNGPGVAVPYVNQMNTPVGLQQSAQPSAAKGLNLKDPGTLGDAQFANAGALNQFLDEFRNARAQEVFSENGQADPLAGSLSGGKGKTASVNEELSPLGAFVASRIRG